MFSDNSFIDERMFLCVIAIGTLLVYLFSPIPNILYREDKSSSNNKNIINFGKNTDCYGVKTTEIDCPFNHDHENDVDNGANDANVHDYNYNKNQ